MSPMRAKLEDRLRQLASLSDADIASVGDAQVKSAYNTLKTYLMLAHPERANPTFLIPELIATGAPARPVNSTLSDGTWQDLREHLTAFYAKHLGQRKPGDASLHHARSVARDRRPPDGNRRARHPELDGHRLPADPRRRQTQVPASVPVDVTRRHQQPRTLQHNSNPTGRFHTHGLGRTDLKSNRRRKRTGQHRRQTGCSPAPEPLRPPQRRSKPS